MPTDGGVQMETMERVHIVPFGYEKERIVIPAQVLDAERVVLLEDPSENQPDFFQEVRDQLRESGIETETESCDIMDMYSVIKAVARVAQRHGGDEVFVNLSTGSKLSAIGGMIACMSTGGATPYYVVPEYYGEEGEEPKPLSHGMEDIRELTEYPIDGPSREEIWILEYLKRQSETSKQVKKADLIEFGKGTKELNGGYGPEEPLPFIAEYSDNETAQYRVLNERIITPLLEKGWITTDERGNRTYVEITDEGRDTLRAFRHLIESV